ncbi:MAG: glycoside hydrolase family 5 protein [Caldilineaceae bacterium]
MMRNTVVPVLLLLLALVGCVPVTEAPVTAVPVPPAQGAQALDPFAVNQALGRGVNMGNALEANYEGEWGMTLDESYFRLIAEAGFTNVRIPIRWTAHAETVAPYTIDPDFLARVDWAIDQALANGLYPIINMHHYDGIMQDPDTHHARFLGIWGQLAEHFQQQQPEVIFELLNEPNTNMLPSRWNKLLAEAIQDVRQTNPARIIIVGPTGWNNANELVNLELPEDDHQLIVTIHSYEPFQFTHQGAEWVNGTDGWLGTTWDGTDAQKRQIIGIFDKAASWGETHHRPIFLGEFGAYSKADMASRARWTAFVARTAEEHKISWAYWEFGSGFGVYDREKQAWNEPLLHALLDK